MADHLVNKIRPSFKARAVMEDSEIRDIQIIKTEIRNCTLYYVNVQTSKLTNCKLYDCTVFNSLVENSALFDTRLHECDFDKLQLKGCNITTSPLEFRKFPSEIRAMIFKHCVAPTNGKTPALLVALRPDQVVYPEALKLFYELNYFVLNEKTMWSCMKRPTKLISNITKLSIDCRPETLRYSQEQEFPEFIIMNAKIKVLHVLGYSSTTWKWIEAGLKQFPASIKKLVVEIDTSVRWSSIGLFDYWTYNSLFGIAATQTKGETPQSTKWVWEVPFGQHRFLELKKKSKKVVT